VTDVKYPESILAADKSILDRLRIGQGIHPGLHEPFLNAMKGLHVIAQRSWLETDDRFLQILPYTMVVQKGLDGQWRVGVYQRAKGKGEERLFLGYSIGFGGHIDSPDFHFDTMPLRQLAAGGSDHVATNVFLPKITIDESTIRENDEEIRVRRTLDDRLVHIESDYQVSHQGLIVDTDCQKVGKYHLGLAQRLEVDDTPDIVEVGCREEAMVFKGMYTLEELRANGMGYAFENWSKMLIDAVNEEFKLLEAA
jgi:predicted NUDIX family phosphoesterase